jgi:hypothetical protein
MWKPSRPGSWKLHGKVMTGLDTDKTRRITRCKVMSGFAFDVVLYSEVKFDVMILGLCEEPSILAR